MPWQMDPRFREFAEDYYAAHSSTHSLVSLALSVCELGPQILGIRRIDGSGQNVGPVALRLCCLIFHARLSPDGELRLGVEMVTLDNYSHVPPGMQQKAVSALTEVLLEELSKE